MTHVNKAKELFGQNYHCSQAVIATFADDSHLALVEWRTEEIKDKILEKL